jgi:hypothetical protein
MTPPVKPEHTGWRDAALSRRHREWGYDAPFSDIDWMGFEFSQSKVMAIFEYKRQPLDWPPDLKHPTMVALRDLADRAGLPLFVVRYSKDLHWYEPVCASNVAHQGWAAYHRSRMDEAHYVAFLYELRARCVPESIAAKLWRAA